MSEFKDHFSGHAAEYSAARPTYPSGLFDNLAAATESRGLALDVATGNGQAAIELASHFDHVVATDASANQIEQAPACARVEYRVAPAEDLGVQSGSADLLTVAQALHWFDHPGFFREADRVLKPGGLLAVWSYGLFTVTPEIEQAVLEFYRDITGPYWAFERSYVEEGYASIAFPWESVPMSSPPMTLEWTAAQALAYLDTWSGVKAYAKATGKAPLGEIDARLSEAWGSGIRRVEWPLALIVRRKTE
ncbi:MAG: ubiquinone/menaquinone biosynthesis C-methylase UbiE [Bradymonadia bacterium]|jgi:ubiquinone/menaquinone biosynthesis C-methylase UbiE